MTFIFDTREDFQPEAKEKTMTEKTLHNTDVSGTRDNVPDVKVFGDGDLFQLLSKASSESEGWMKSCKAMQTIDGCVVQVTTQQRNLDGTYAVAEALTYVPGVSIETIMNEDGTIAGRRLASFAVTKTFERRDNLAGTRQVA